MAAQADPITLELFKNAIFSIADEMALTVCRTTYSGVLKDNMDYSTGFADADGKLAAQGLALPGHLGSVPTAMAAIMRRFKDDIAPGKLAARVGSPALREKHKPGLLAGAGAQLRFLLRKSAPSPNWKSLDPSWRMPAGPLPATTAVATGALDIERTNRFAEKARALGVSTNTLLLSALVKASRPFVCEGSALWRMPVNMRGPVKGISPLSNYCSFIEIPVGEDDSAARLHQQIKTSFTRREHCAAWFLCSIGNYVGIRGMQVIHKIYHAMSKGRPGSGPCRTSAPGTVSESGTSHPAASTPARSEPASSSATASCCSR
jgi:hypothetical protein